MPCASLRVKAPISRFSSTLMRGNRRRASGTGAIPRRTRSEVETLLMTWPSKTTVPARGLTMPSTVFIVVDLPQALPPSRQTISPCLMS